MAVTATGNPAEPAATCSFFVPAMCLNPPYPVLLPLFWQQRSKSRLIWPPDMPVTVVVVGCLDCCYKHSHSHACLLLVLQPPVCRRFWAVSFWQMVYPPGTGHAYVQDCVKRSSPVVCPQSSGPCGAGQVFPCYVQLCICNFLKLHARSWKGFR